MTFPEARLERLREIEDRHFWFRGRRRLLLRLLRRAGVEPPARILDFGAGAGANSLLLANRGYRVTAADGLAHGLARLRRAEPRVAAAQCLADRLAFRGSSFDCILLLDVLEHADDEVLLDQAIPLLVPGGVLIATAPAFPALWSYRDVGAGHRRRYRRAGLAGLLTARGLAVESIGYYQFLLFPIVFLSRWAGRGNAVWRDREDLPSAGWNAICGAVTSAELALSSFCRLPWGSSLAVAARKTS